MTCPLFSSLCNPRERREGEDVNRQGVARFIWTTILSRVGELGVFLLNKKESHPLETLGVPRGQPRTTFYASNEIFIFNFYFYTISTTTIFIRSSHKFLCDSENVKTFFFSAICIWTVHKLHLDHFYDLIIFKFWQIIVFIYYSMIF